MVWNLLHDPQVSQYIDALRELYAMETAISVQMLVAELKSIVYLDPMSTLEQRLNPKTGKFEFFTKDLESLQKMGPYIKKYKIHKKTGEIEVEFYDKMEAIEKLMKYTDGYNAHNKSLAPTSGVAIYLPDNGRNPVKEVDK